MTHYADLSSVCYSWLTWFSYRYTPAAQAVFMQAAYQYTFIHVYSRLFVQCSTPTAMQVHGMVRAAIIHNVHTQTTHTPVLPVKSKCSLVTLTKKTRAKP